ncbi:5628_t:CDS:1, partial [Acaulospora morrowiae]
QVSLPNPEYEILFKRIKKLESLNQQLLSENETLKRLLNEKLTDEQDHLKLVMEIAKMK